MNWAKNRSRALCRLTALVLLAAPSFSLAETMYIHKGDQVTILLHSEPCKQEGVTNLPRRATWQEKGKLTEGCWGVYPPIGLVMLYFADKTVVGMPAQFFEKAGGT